ncbi:MAG: hypothetical protein INR71_06750, partial [Terriglobus roseus]|nr:hypothetical protein [Terriglobus roseus]
MGRPAKRARLLEESESDDGEGPSAKFRVNEEYARRFEHNKKREEKHRLEEKYGKPSKVANADGSGGDESEGGSSSSEEEDDDAELATAALDAEISATLKAIRAKDPRVYDKTSAFYSQLEPAQRVEAEAGTKKEKPMHLRDYHRQNLLQGSRGDTAGADDVGEDGEPSEGALPSYVQQQQELRDSVVKAMHAAVQEEDDDGASNKDESSGKDDDDDFLVAKPARKVDAAPSSVRALPDVESADKDPETFLSNFMSSRAWLPTHDSKLQPFESDDSEDDARAEA